MRILPQIAKSTAARLPALKFWLRVLFVVCGAILVYRAEQERIVRDAQAEAEYKAYVANLWRETEADIQRSDEQFASIYRGLNTILSHAGLHSIGDGS